MLDIGGWEIFLILAIALIVVGPKDLPVLVKKVGQWVGRAKAMARDFQSGMDEAAREVELDEVRKAADVRSIVDDETRKINSDLRSSVESLDVDLDDAPPSARRPASAAERPASRPEPARPRAPAEADDDSVLANFKRGVHSRE